MIGSARAGPVAVLRSVDEATQNVGALDGPTVIGFFSMKAGDPPRYSVIVQRRFQSVRKAAGTSVGPNQAPEASAASVSRRCPPDRNGVRGEVVDALCHNWFPRHAAATVTASRLDRTSWTRTQAAPVAAARAVTAAVR